ncbi:lipoprotein-anchoring transpeptidase ErfK/SrfK [Limimaricola variabilis]|uniref:Lipoprotein-anchoring transpeptidase ErfK/SrfK n=1 Tax=Limimaricola variabilis TaxID=1492771 RepID=A0ABR6HSY5_9RHOB|nr:L,D-transpeptidase [Limimaricola variabilis]MBB3713518.1 lipoprotein-anchoring transpeptidase ErfK/SrfK [Limimaricola variabilis]
MIDRRYFLAAGTALGILGTGARAHENGDEAAQLPERFLPRMVDIPASMNPGELHVDPNRFALYWTLPGGKAMRYSVGVGREGLYETGVFRIGAKKEWPSWTPTPDMIEREPEKYKQYEDGMPGGPENPLGARALYLFDGGRDTFLRIHGTNAPSTIGTAVSNGCARLVNDHIIELYPEVPMETTVFLYPKLA